MVDVNIDRNLAECYNQIVISVCMCYRMQNKFIEIYKEEEMNTLEFKKIKILAANMGEDNCLPDMMNDSYIHAKINVADNIPESDKKYIGKGMINTLLPYKIQDNYDRSRNMKEFNAAILENEFLKAVVVPELGGRLWSLYDKNSQKELLYSNDVFQPCNLALRNAWFSGGVEWNIGIKGHNPLTCSPMFAQKLTDTDGAPMLRMYEYERIRGVAYSITAKLESDILMVNICIENNEDKDKYMYWWSNIAVEETKKTRVITPADSSFYCSYTENGYYLDMMNLPYLSGSDVSYATNLERSRDFFYNIPEDEEKWITALNKDGYGLLHMSTKELKGRKLFAWGQGNGGRHWNEWLSDCGKNYIEIQAGLLKTQLEHFVMKANSTLSFTEGYSALSADPYVVHGDYKAAQAEVKSKISQKIERVKKSSFIYECEEKPCYIGSGWGALENMTSDCYVSNFNNFDESSLGEEQKEWLELLKCGTFPEPDTDKTITSYVKGKKWIDLLKKAPDNWYKSYHLGVLYYIDGDSETSMKYFKDSVKYKENPWAYRNIAQLEKINGNYNEALKYMKKAVNLKNDYQPLLVNCAEIMLMTGNYEEWISIYESADDGLKENGRLKMLYALALNRIGKTEAAQKIINKDFIMPDIKEGEFSLSHLWVEIYKNLMQSDGFENLSVEDVLDKYPLPYELDFRMH